MLFLGVLVWFDSFSCYIPIVVVVVVVTMVLCSMNVVGVHLFLLLLFY